MWIWIHNRTFDYKFLFQVFKFKIISQKYYQFVLFCTFNLQKKTKRILKRSFFSSFFLPLDPDPGSGFQIRINKIIESGPTTLVNAKKFYFSNYQILISNWISYSLLHRLQNEKLTYYSLLTGSVIFRDEDAKPTKRNFVVKVGVYQIFTEMFFKCFVLASVSDWGFARDWHLNPNPEWGNEGKSQNYYFNTNYFILLFDDGMLLNTEKTDFVGFTVGDISFARRRKSFKWDCCLFFRLP
jgi:hypothetical protein